MIGYCKEVTENEEYKDCVNNSVGINQKATKKSKKKGKKLDRKTRK